MGNTPSHPKLQQQQQQQQPHTKRNLNLNAAEEEERKFREKIGVIEIADHHRHLANSNSSNTSVTDDFTHASKASNNKANNNRKKAELRSKNKEESFSRHHNQQKSNRNPMGRASPGFEVIRLLDGSGILSHTASGISMMSHEETEALMAEMQKKFALVDSQQQACLQQIQHMNQEMEAYRLNAVQQMEEKDGMISKQAEEISQLKAELLKFKQQEEEDGGGGKGQQSQEKKPTEVKNLVRKIAVLKNNLMIVQQERDAALAKSSNTSVKEDGSPATNNNNNNNNNTDVDEMSKTIQELLQQLEDSEMQHTNEQKVLQEEVLTLQKRVERLENAVIRVEHERDEAIANWDASKKQLDVEKALNASDLKKYQTELQKWKARYLQEKAAEKNHSSADHIQKNAVMLGNKLGAGILEGMEEDQTQATYIINYGDRDTFYDYDDDDDEDQSEIASSLSHLNVVTHYNNAGPVNAVPSENSGEMIWNPNTKTETEQAFDATISIPNFLSQVW